MLAFWKTLRTYLINDRKAFTLICNPLKLLSAASSS